jgi:hypothetical protein
MTEPAPPLADDRARAAAAPATARAAAVPATEPGSRRPVALPAPAPGLSGPRGLWHPARIMGSKLVAVFCGMWLLGACAKKDPLYCDEETPCTDPALPFCDLTGEHPASEGIGRTCIPDPFPDAGVPPGEVELTVVKTGAGGGDIVSSPAGIECGATCSATFPEGTEVTLTSEADSSSTFIGWQNDCTGLAPCALTLDGLLRTAGAASHQDLRYRRGRLRRLRRAGHQRQPGRGWNLRRNAGRRRLESAHHRRRNGCLRRALRAIGRAHLVSFRTAGSDSVQHWHKVISS